MKTIILSWLLAAALAGGAAARAAEETAAERDARMQWWREAKFGMFIHWGLYAVPAGTWQGKQIGGIGEWIMHDGQIPMADYAGFAKQFNPVKFNAREWARIAKAAGMKYIVITSKHHDGFAMFHSQASAYNIFDATPFKRDPLQELAAACRKEGLKLGFYYSQFQDWGHPGGGIYGGRWDAGQAGDLHAYVNQVAIPQVREILSNYGRVAVLWWDTPGNISQADVDQLHGLLKLQPGIISNNRLGGGYAGDTETPEQSIPASGYPGRDWETCMTINDTWGFKSYDHNFKSTETLLRNLVDIVSKGGNYLLNVGPTAEGLIPQPEVDRLKEIGAWLDVNGAAIYGATPGPLKRAPAWGRVTCRPFDVAQGRPGKLYLHVFQWPADGVLKLPVQVEVKQARLLADRRQLEAAGGADGLTVRLTGAAPDKLCSVVELSVAGPVTAIAMPLAQQADGTITLPVGEALTGNEPQVESKDGQDNLGFWMNPAATARWTFKVSQPGKFTVRAPVASPGAASRITIEVASQRLEVTAPQTGDYGRFQVVECGMVTLDQAQPYELVIKPVADGWAPINLRALTLQPVR